MMICWSRSTEKHPKDYMCKDALGVEGKQVNKNLEGAGRGGELGGSIQTMYSQSTEALDKAMEESSTLREVPRPH